MNTNPRLVDDTQYQITQDRNLAIVGIALGAAGLLKAFSTRIYNPQLLALALPSTPPPSFSGAAGLALMTPIGAAGTASLRQIEQSDLLHARTLFENVAQTIIARHTFPAAGVNAAVIPAILGGGAGTNGHVVPNVPDDIFALLNATQTFGGQKTFPGPGATAPIIPALRQVAGGFDISVPVPAAPDSLVLLSNTRLPPNGTAIGDTLRWNGTAWTNQALAPKRVTATGNTTLAATDRYVIVDGAALAAQVTLQFPSAPPNGTPITVVIESINGALTAGVLCQANGSDKMYSATLSNIWMGSIGASCTFTYDSTTLIWALSGMTQQRVRFRWDAGTAGDYLQQGIVSALGGTLTFNGGALATALPLGRMSYGTVIINNLMLTARANVGANHTIALLRTNNNVFSAASNFAGVAFSATIPTGVSAGAAGAPATMIERVFQAPLVASPENLLVLQCSTNITTAIDGELRFYTI